MSKFTSFSALACALVLSTPTLAQECCEAYVVYQPSPYCCQTTFIEHMPIYAWNAEPAILDQVAFDGVEVTAQVENDLLVDNPLTYEERLVWTGCNWQMMLVALSPTIDETFVKFETMEESVVYQEQAFWNGSGWQTMLVAVPAIQSEQIAYQEGDVHTVGRATYVDNTVAGEVIPEIPAATPSEDSNRDLATEPDTDDIKFDDDNLDDGDPKDGDSVDDIDDEGDDDDDDGLADK